MNAIALDEASLAARLERLDALKTAIARSVIGQAEVVEQLLIALQLRQQTPPCFQLLYAGQLIKPCIQRLPHLSQALGVTLSVLQ